VGLLVNNLDSHNHDIAVSLSPEDQSGSAASSVAKIDGSKAQGAAEKVTVPAGGSASISFNLACLKAGKLKLRFRLDAGSALNEVISVPLEIEKPLVSETVTTTGIVQADKGGAASVNEQLVLPAAATGAAEKRLNPMLSVTLDADRLILLKSAVDYLFHYPYGCLEQRSAAVLPLIIFGGYTTALGLNNEVKDPLQTVKDEIAAWAKSQLPDGSFPYWPDGTSSDYYVSLRIAHVLALAKAKGISSPIDTDKLLKYLDAAWNSSESGIVPLKGFAPDRSLYLKAYALYVDTLMPQLSSSNKMLIEQRLEEITTNPGAGVAVQAFAGLCYANLGLADKAAGVAAKLKSLMRMTTQGVDITDAALAAAPLQGCYYGGRVEQLALCLQFFSVVALRDTTDMALTRRLLNTLLAAKQSRNGTFRPYWDNTAVTVRVLEAVAALIQADNLQNVNVKASATLDRVELLKGNLQGLGAAPLSATFNANLPPLDALGRNVNLPLVFSAAGGSLYYSASLQYALPAETVEARDEGISVYSWVGPYITELPDAQTEPAESSVKLKAAATYRMTVHISSTMDRTYLALRVPVPTGSEILNAAFVTTASNAGKAANDDKGRLPSRQTIMQNEVRYFWDSFPKGEAVVSFLFRPLRTGVFPTPPAQAECMYESEIFGRSNGALYTVGN
jgi:uncharacterized protein YfaS (alpha-2-macroglobulin family)